MIYCTKLPIKLEPTKKVYVVFCFIVLFFFVLTFLSELFKYDSIPAWNFPHPIKEICPFLRYEAPKKKKKNS